MKIVLAACAAVLSGCVTSVELSDLPDTEDPPAEVMEGHHGLPFCPPGYVNPHPYVTCITDRPTPTTP